jgi:lysophospholipase L1-like esterase
MSFKSIIDFFRNLWAKLFGPKPTLVMIGDSIIANLTTTDTQKLMRPPFNTALNLGVHGETTTQIRARIGTIPAGIPVLLEGFANNFSFGMEASIVPDFTAMLAALTPTNHVVLLGMCQVDGAPDTGLNIKINDYNAQINAASAGYQNVTIAKDAQTVSMTGLTIDGEHPSTAGYIVLFNALAPVV